MEQSETEYNKPFQYENELKEKLARQSELDAMLDLGNNIESMEDTKQEILQEERHEIQEDNGNREYTGNSYVAEGQGIGSTRNRTSLCSSISRAGYYEERKNRR